jgi:hypothetical protein
VRPRRLIGAPGRPLNFTVRAHDMKHHLTLTLLVVLSTAPWIAYAAGGSANRLATVTLGKRFNPTEVDAVLEPVFTPLGLARVSGRAQDRALGAPELSWYGALGYAPGIPSLYFEGSGALSVLIFADRSLNCLRISVTDMTQAPDQRVIPTINTIVNALSKQYGADMKHYSDLQCLHAL